MADEVIEQLWRIKDAMAKEHGYDIVRLAADLEGRQGKEGHRIVNLQALREAGERRVTGVRGTPRDRSEPSGTGS